MAPKDPDLNHSILNLFGKFNLYLIVNNLVEQKYQF